MGAYKCKYDEAKTILMDANAWNDAARIPRYRRPPILAEKQNNIIDAAQNPNVRIIFIEGPRRTGKSTCGFVIIYEEGINGNKKWGVWGATEDSASKILRDITNDIHFPDLTCHIMNATAQRVTCDNGVMLEAHASKISDAKGLQYNGVWITEFDQLLRKEPQVFAAILAILRSEPNMKIILDANMDTGAYKAFKDKFNELPENVQAKVRFFTLLKEDVHHIPDDADDLLRPLMEAAVGKDKVDQQLSNVESYEGEVFHVQDVIDAIDTYSYWVNSVHPQPDRVVIGIDPGQGHATGIMILGQHNDHLYEIESHEFVGKRLDKDNKLIAPKVHQKQVSEDYLKTFIVEKAHQYHADIVCETNSGGAWWMQHWRDQPGMKLVKSSDFGKPGSRNDRNGFIHELSQLLGDGKFHFKNDQLRSQLISYNPDDRETVEWSNKGDLADATLHAAHYIIKKEKHTNKKPLWDGRNT